MQADIVAIRAVAWWLLSWHWHLWLSPFPYWPPRDLCSLFLPLGHGMERPHAHANRR
jgi:hypothetical protein